MERLHKALKDHGYTDKQIIFVCEKLSTIDDSFKECLNLWVANGVITEVNVCGISLKQLMSKFKMEYPAALLTMDWLKREPEKALKSIKRGIR